jgi:hypothetical protein
MQNLLPDLLPRLEAHRLPGLDAGPGALYPFYDGLSLASLPASICHWLGAPGFGAPPFPPEILNLYGQAFEQVILLVVDGMGLDTLENALRLAEEDPDYAVWAELAHRAALAPLTSLAPSTTSTVLTTFWTGRTPAEHGVLGYEVWLKEYGLIANMIRHCPASYAGDSGSLSQAGFDPQTFLPAPTLGPHLVQHGIASFAFQPASIARSGLSTMLLPGVESVPYHSLSDLWVTLEALLDRRARARSYIYVYWGALDEHSHRFGPRDERVRRELADFSRQLGRFIGGRLARGAGNTLLIVTADHGHIATPRRAEYAVVSHPRLMDCLAMAPSGEARLAYVFLRPGREQAFLEYVEQAWPGQFRLAPSSQAIEAGLFGGSGAHERLAERVGDYVVMPQGSAYWWFSHRENHLLGRHGGLSRAEMLVPFFGALL